MFFFLTNYTSAFKKKAMIRFFYYLIKKTIFIIFNRWEKKIFNDYCPYLVIHKIHIQSKTLLLQFQFFFWSE